jgi:hypothetical protein
LVLGTYGWQTWWKKKKNCLCHRFWFSFLLSLELFCGVFSWLKKKKCIG